MNLKIVGIVLAIIQILIAVWYFDRNSTNQIGISAILALSGVSLLLGDAESANLKKTGRFMLFFAAAIAISLVLKVLILG